MEELQLSTDQIINNMLTAILRKEQHLSFSAISNFRESPRDFIKYKLHTVEPTEAMLYGQMVHCLVLEPGDFYNRYFVLDDVAKKEEIGGAKPAATAAYKAWLADMEKNANGKQLVTTADYTIAEQISRDVRFNDASSRILSICPEREQKIEWEFGNYKWQGFKDMSGKDAVADLKTCQDANPRKFRYDIINNWYYGQAAMYLTADAIISGVAPEDINGVFHKDYYIIAVDKTGGVSCHLLKPNLIQRGFEEYQEMINKFSECVLKDAFDKSYDFHAQRWDGLYEVDKPSW